MDWVQNTASLHFRQVLRKDFLRAKYFLVVECSNSLKSRAFKVIYRVCFPVQHFPGRKDVHHLQGILAAAGLGQLFKVGKPKKAPLLLVDKDDVIFFFHAVCVGSFSGMQDNFYPVQGGKGDHGMGFEPAGGARCGWKSEQ